MDFDLLGSLITFGGVVVAKSSVGTLYRNLLVRLPFSRCTSAGPGSERAGPGDWSGMGGVSLLSNEKDPSCLGYKGDHTTQLYGDYIKP